MCSSNAFYYRRCRRGHIRFEQVSTCLAVRVGWRRYCRADRILNGDPGAPRAWPTLDRVCPECHPEKAAAQDAERRREAAAAGGKVGGGRGRAEAVEGGGGEKRYFFTLPRCLGICGASR